MFRPVDFMMNAKVTNKQTKISFVPSLSSSYDCHEIMPYFFMNLEFYSIYGMKIVQRKKLVLGKDQVFNLGKYSSYFSL